MNDCWMMWMIRTVSPLRALSPGVLRRWYKPSWVTLKQMMNDFRMKWNESYCCHSIMDLMTAKWDFVSVMTPKRPEWCRNYWNDRDFCTKGWWLEFLKSSALDQSEASIFGSRPIGSLDFSPSKFDSRLKIPHFWLIFESFLRSSLFLQLFP